MLRQVGQMPRLGQTRGPGATALWTNFDHVHTVHFR